jgi:hypothetical protein
MHVEAKQRETVMSTASKRFSEEMRAKEGIAKALLAAESKPKASASAK